MRLAAIVLALAGAVVTAVWPSGTALCFESGGAVVLEPASAPCCQETSQPAAPGPAGRADCEDCTDQELGLAILGKTGPAAVFDAPLACERPADPEAGPAGLAAVSSAAPTAPDAPISAHLASVILLV